MTIEEKLEKAVRLADAMYYAAQMLSTDASHLRKATEDWWQFENVELKESEDENVREYLIRYIDNTMKSSELKSKLLAWLEKQGEQKASYTTIVEMGNGGINALVTRDLPTDGCDDEQKPIDKVEPKFRVKYGGSEYNVFEIKDIAGVTFYGIEDEPNHIDYVKAENCEIISGYAIKENGSPYPTKPAVFTKQKPKRMISAETKESLLHDKYEGLTDFERTLADICIGWIGQELGLEQYIKDNADVLLKIAIKKFNSIQDAPFEQKSAWSEEDERHLNTTIAYLKDAQEFKKTAENCIDWLNSLKQRIGGEQ